MSIVVKLACSSSQVCGRPCRTHKSIPRTEPCAGPHRKERQQARDYIPQQAASSSFPNASNPLLIKELRLATVFKGTWQPCPQANILENRRPLHIGNYNHTALGERQYKRPRLAFHYHMDPPSRPPGPSGLSRKDSASSDSQSTLIKDASEGARENTFDGRGPDTLRRGHSEGDMLTVASNPHRHVLGGHPAREGETWIDFLRESPSNGQTSQEWAHAATKRAAMVAADRITRMTRQHADFVRRRSASSISSEQAASARIPQTFSPTQTDTLLARPRRPPGNLNSTGSIERPPYNTPSMADGPNRRNREIVLPRWQPDAEVSKCPICGTIFSFWYRKHHCRKCGRVVCANCSPHRITIPRQFIVHPPIEIALGSRDDREDLAPPELGLRGEGRPRSQDYHLDPALGGGQEVRLCNPCVPDPNPLPPPGYPSPGPHDFHSFPRPDGFAVRPPPQSPLPRARTHLSHTQPGEVPVNSRSSAQLGHTYRQEHPPRHETSAARKPVDEPLVPDRYESLEEFLLRQRGRGLTVSLAACTFSETY